MSEEKTVVEVDETPTAAQEAVTELATTSEIPVVTAKPPKLVRYMNRRSTHSSRALITVIALLLFMAAAIFLVVERIIQLSGYRAIFAPRDVVWVMTEGIHTFPDWTVWVASAVAIVLGLLLLGKAVASGWLKRHALLDNRLSIVADDAVIASGMSRRIRRHAQLQRGQVRTRVERKRITVKVTPTSGLPLDLADLMNVANEEVTAYQPKPRLKVRVQIAPQGVIEP